MMEGRESEYVLQTRYRTALGEHIRRGFAKRKREDDEGSRKRLLDQIVVKGTDSDHERIVGFRWLPQNSY